MGISIIINNKDLFFCLDAKEYVSGRTVSQKIMTVRKNLEIQRCTSLKFLNSLALNIPVDITILFVFIEC